jgi:DNA-binding IclR family transcriptional regulator
MELDFKNDMISRVISVVSYLASANTPKRLTDISRDLELSKASVFRILRGLENGHWVVSEPETGMYKIGYKIMEMGLSILANTNIAVICRPFLLDLRDASGETVGLSIRVDNKRMFVDDAQSNHEVRFITPLGKTLPLWIGAIGKVILANMMEREITSIFEELTKSGLPRLSSGKVLDIIKLSSELAQIKQEGYAISIGERELGASAVASAIFDHHNEVIGAISIAGPSERLNGNILRRYSLLVKETAKKVNQRTGGSNTSLGLLGASLS